MNIYNHTIKSLLKEAYYNRPDIIKIITDILWVYLKDGAFDYIIEEYYPDVNEQDLFNEMSVSDIDVEEILLQIIASEFEWIYIFSKNTGERFPWDHIERSILENPDYGIKYYTLFPDIFERETSFEFDPKLGYVSKDTYNFKYF